jgi:hypothetical protein
MPEAPGWRVPDRRSTDHIRRPQHAPPPSGLPTDGFQHRNYDLHARGRLAGTVVPGQIATPSKGFDGRDAAREVAGRMRDEHRSTGDGRQRAGIVSKDRIDAVASSYTTMPNVRVGFIADERIVRHDERVGLQDALA